MFFYAGHGLQVDGRNYMVPVDADVANEADLPFQLVSLDIALQRLATERFTNIVILDYSIKQMSGSAEGWTKPFRVELQRLLKQAGLYDGSLDGVFGPEVWSAVREVQTLPSAPTPGGLVPAKRWDPQSIPVNAPLPQ